jgi:septum formation protein
MLRAAGVLFSVIPANLDEASIKNQIRAAQGDALAAATALAAAKAAAVSTRDDRALVIGADQILALDDVWFDKPTDPAQLQTQLRSLRGRTHQLISAVALVQGGFIIWQTASVARLTVRRFSESFLQDYVAQGGEALCASVGGYRIEASGIQLFERIEGDHFTILGLPLLPLLDELRQRGVLPA